MSKASSTMLRKSSAMLRKSSSLDSAMSLSSRKSSFPDSPPPPPSTPSPPTLEHSRSASLPAPPSPQVSPPLGQSRSNSLPPPPTEDLSEEDKNRSSFASSGLAEHEKMMRLQAKLLKIVKDREKEQSRGAEVRPCDSCEFPDAYEDPTTCCWNIFSMPFKKKNVIQEFWLISSPVKDSQVTLEKLNQATVPQNLSTNYKFHIPKLRSGNINQMLELTDDLSKLDSSTEGLVRKLSEFMYAILEEADHISEYFEVNQLDILTYITRFTWDEAKYSSKNSLTMIYDRIKQLTDVLDIQLKKRIHDFNELNKNLQNNLRQHEGNLLNKSLHGIIKKEDVISDSEYLTTLFVVVPRSDAKKFFKCYETLADMVVPKSAYILQNDEFYSLFCVALCKKSVEEFTRCCSERKFVVRDFKYREGKMKQEKDMLKKLCNLRRAQIAVYYRWIKVNFSECFSAWIHVKALRLFVESVLKYGLHTEFLCMLLIPLRSTIKLRKVLNKLFHTKDPTVFLKKPAEDIPWCLNCYEIPPNACYCYLPIKIDIFTVMKHNSN